LTNSEIVFFYREILGYCESDLKERRFYVRSKSVQRYIKTNQLCLVVTSPETPMPDIEDFFSNNLIGFWFTDSKRNQVASLLTHLRNSVAHCSIQTKKINNKNFYFFTDKHRNQLTMVGKLPTAMFPSLIKILKSSDIKQVGIVS